MFIKLNKSIIWHPGPSAGLLPRRPNPCAYPYIPQTAPYRYPKAAASGLRINNGKTTRLTKVETKSMTGIFRRSPFVHLLLYLTIEQTQDGLYFFGSFSTVWNKRSGSLFNSPTTKFGNIGFARTIPIYRSTITGISPASYSSHPKPDRCSATMKKAIVRKNSVEQNLFRPIIIM